MHKKIVMIIQARMGSSRLPGKSMFDLAGSPLVGRILERVQRCKMLDEIILAIPNTIENLPLKRLACNYNVNCFEGDEHNVLLRYFDAATKYNATHIVRLPADNPVPEAKEIDRIIAFHLKQDRPGFSSNLAQIRGSGYPDGIGAEIFDYCLLQDAINACVDQNKKEHVHLNFYDYQLDEAVDEKWCPIGVIKCPDNIRRPDLILDVNTEDQYKFMKKLYEALYFDNPCFGIKEIIDWYDNSYIPTQQKK